MRTKSTFVCVGLLVYLVSRVDGGDRVRLDVPDEADPDHNRPHSLTGTIAREDDLRERKADLNEEIESLRSRIDHLERTAVETLQGYLDDLVERLAYENIARVRVDRVTPNGQKPSQFHLSIVREGPGGAREEPQGLQTLSESERALLGVAVALAGYRTHSVEDTVPMLLLDSIEEFDGERIRRLVDYIGAEVPRVVCALLPEDTDSVDASATVSAEQLGAD